MGIYDTYSYGREDEKRSVQIKTRTDGTVIDGSTFLVGEIAPLEDGIYMDYNGAVIILYGRVIAVFEPEELHDKYGNDLPVNDIMDRTNPVAQWMRQESEKCACNWFVAQDINGQWIHTDGTECHGIHCNAPDPSGSKGE